MNSEAGRHPAGTSKPGGMAPTAKDSLLEVRHLTHSFGGVQAVADVSFTIARSSFTGLIGPNGAGKSTLVDCISGLHRHYGGEVYFRGQNVTDWRMDRIARLGLVRTFQVSRIFNHMSLLSNLMTAPLKQSGEELLVSLSNRWGTEEAQYLERARELIQQFGLGDVWNNYGLELSGGQRRLAELCRCAMVGPAMLLLDEPFSGVSPANRGHLSDLLRSLNRDQNITIVMIEHRLELIEQLCDDIIVMAEGQVIGRGRLDQLRRDPKVVTAYLGEVGSIAP